RSTAVQWNPSVAGPKDGVAPVRPALLTYSYRRMSTDSPTQVREVIGRRAWTVALPTIRPKKSGAPLALTSSPRSRRLPSPAGHTSGTLPKSAGLNVVVPPASGAAAASDGGRQPAGASARAEGAAIVSSAIVASNQTTTFSGPDAVTAGPGASIPRRRRR